jgi:uncharacterized protein
VRWHRSVAVLAFVGVGLAAGCGGEPLAQDDPTTVSPPSEETVVPGGRSRLDGFKEITVTVVDADGHTRTFCLLLADTPELQQRGLMFVTDEALGGYDGMVFRYEQDANGGFWMRNTRLPLSIAWIRADGSTVSTTNMEPCPDGAPTCPVYPPGGAYRYAIEVPHGQLEDLGISDRSRVTLGAEECAPA